MKTFKITILTGFPEAEHTDYFEVDDDATEFDIEQVALESVFNKISFSYVETTSD